MPRLIPLVVLYLLKNFCSEPNHIAVAVEIVKSNYSQQWNTWYATAVTADNSAVFFAYRQELAKGAKYTIVGTVKAHRDGSTQLNRVSII